MWLRFSALMMMDGALAGLEKVVYPLLNSDKKDGPLKHSKAPKKDPGETLSPREARQRAALKQQRQTYEHQHKLRQCFESLKKQHESLEALQRVTETLNLERRAHQKEEWQALYGAWGKAVQPTGSDVAQLRSIKFAPMGDNN